MKIKRTHSRTIYLLRKFIKNECTKEEIKELTHLFRKEKYNGEIDVVTYSLWQAVNRTINSSGNDVNVLRTEASKIINRKRKRSRANKIYLIPAVATAAAVALLLIFLNLPLQKTGTAEQSPFALQITEARRFTTENSMKKITLADGSVVHLNLHTTLTLKKGKFNAHVREVWLDEGEVFFEITKDPHRPFIVHTSDGLATRVLGTSFNIQAYSGLKRHVISVKTGKVQVNREDGEEGVVLDPDYQVSFDRSSNTFTAGKTDGAIAAAWREGKIVFQRAKIEEIALRLKQHFDMELIYDPSRYENVEYSAIFPVHASIDEIANTLSKIYNTNYSIKGQTLFLE
ncbi:MAG: FecR domain-containing protein [Proteiniphilum sp.]|jgi:ferric-dicitrate binding protein FerR (iron transport regulator)|nr:FecR domain-containing protein [Proteiniphilum sp.]